MSIEKLKNGNYKAVFWNLGKRQGIKTFERRKDAVNWLALTQQTYQKSDFPCFDTSFEEVSQIWIVRYADPNKAFSSVVKDKQMLSQNINPYFGKSKLRSINPEDIEDFVSMLKRTTKLSNASINRTTALIKKIFNDCIKWRFVETNPVVAVKKLKESEIGYDYWGVEECERFLSHTELHCTYHLLYKVTLNTGLRLGEIIALKWDAIDFDNQVIRVSRTWCGKERRIKETTKGNKIRYIGINGTIQDGLRALAGTIKDRNRMVFYPAENMLHNHNAFSRQALQKNAKQAGVKIIRFHDLRHTFGSHYMMNGGNIYDLKEILGHSDIKTTMRYAHLSPNHLKQKMEMVRFDSLSAKVNFKGESNLVALKINTMR